MESRTSAARCRPPRSRRSSRPRSARGIDLFDTAAAYGASERVLGNALGSWADLRIVSKLPALAADRIGEAEIEQCRTALENSLALLRRRSIYALLLHRAR